MLVGTLRSKRVYLLEMNTLHLLYGFVLCFLVTSVVAQEVTVSTDVSLRNNHAYEIIGRVQESILLYQEKSRKQSVIVYNQDLVQQSERQIHLRGKRPKVYEVLNVDSAFAILYGYYENKAEVLQMDFFSATAELRDSITISIIKEDWRGLNLETLVSEDESKIAFYQIEGKTKLQLVIYDITRDILLHDSEYLFKNVNLYNELIDLYLSNEGDFYILTEANNTKARKEFHHANIYHFLPTSENVLKITIPLKNIICGDLMLSIDNQNHQIGVAGLYDKKRYTESSGFLWIAGRPGQFSNLPVHFFPFEEDLLFEVNGDRGKQRLEDFVIADVIWKHDGSPVLTFEMRLDLSRRQAGGYGLNTANSGNFAGNTLGWSDHYREDVVLISLSKTKQIEWHRVFYKRQFSQSDGGVFSSFFPFLTPSRLRLIYNDEIKAHNTVSEYIIDPLGNYKRTSVLSTEYQNLKLRFLEARQISSTEVLIPSQKSYVFNLVKIDFGKQ